MIAVDSKGSYGGGFSALLGAAIQVKKSLEEVRRHRSGSGISFDVNKGEISASLGRTARAKPRLSKSLLAS